MAAEINQKEHSPVLVINHPGLKTTTFTQNEKVIVVENGKITELFSVALGNRPMRGELDADRPAQDEGNSKPANPEKYPSHAPAQDEEQGDICEICKQSIRGIKELCKKEHPVSDGPEKTLKGELTCPSCHSDEVVKMIRANKPNVREGHYFCMNCAHTWLPDGSKCHYGPEFEFEWDNCKCVMIDMGNRFVVNHPVYGIIEPDDKEFYCKVLPFITARLSYRKKEVWEKV